MADLLIEGGTVVTQNPRREVIDDGTVAVEGDRILAVGDADALADEYDPKERLDATGSAVIPGLVNPHTHVSDILLRGSCGTDRGLYDWLFNIKQPGIAQMTAEEHELSFFFQAEDGIRAVR